MRYAGIIKNDVVNAPGICVTVYVQGCPIHCPGCHNAELWDFDGGKEFGYEQIQKIEEALTANGIHRNLCIQGGEPLCQENCFTTGFIVQQIKEDFPDIKIYLWTGYTLENLKDMNNTQINYILSKVDYLIDGRFEQANRDVSLFMRGSTNQRIIDLKSMKIIDNPEKF